MQPLLVALADTIEGVVEKSHEAPATGGVPPLSNLEAIIGDSVSAMIPETTTAPASVKANSRNSAPVKPETNPMAHTLPPT